MKIYFQGLKINFHGLIIYFQGLKIVLYFATKKFVSAEENFAISLRNIW